MVLQFLSRKIACLSYEDDDSRSHRSAMTFDALLILSIMIFLRMFFTPKYAKFVLSFFVLGFSFFLVYSLFSGLKKKTFEGLGFDDVQNAEVSIQNLSFVQTEAGLVSWSLDAKGAALTEKGRQGLLKNVSVSIPYGNEQTLFLKGDEGAVDTEKKEFSLWKNTGLMSVDLKNGYTLHTRGIEWRASQREIVSQGEAMITGSQIKINGNSLRVSVDKQEMIVIGDVRALVY